jgi:septal ring-binding cell division protein DamX
MEAAAADAGASAAASADAWVVQIAAYRDKAAAQAAAREINYAGLIIMPIRREDEDWFVLLLGAYEKKADAEQAGKAYVNTLGGDYWVRSARSLQQLLRQEPG